MITSMIYLLLLAIAAIGVGFLLYYLFIVLGYLLLGLSILGAACIVAVMVYGIVATAVDWFQNTPWVRKWSNRRKAQALAARTP